MTKADEKKLIGYRLYLDDRTTKGGRMWVTRAGGTDISFSGSYSDALVLRHLQEAYGIYNQLLRVWPYMTLDYSGGQEETSFAAQTEIAALKETLAARRAERDAYAVHMRALEVQLAEASADHKNWVESAHKESASLVATINRLEVKLAEWNADPKSGVAEARKERDAFWGNLYDRDITKTRETISRLKAENMEMHSRINSFAGIQQELERVKKERYAAIEGGNQVRDDLQVRLNASALECEKWKNGNLYARKVLAELFDALGCTNEPRALELAREGATARELVKKLKAIVG